MKDHWLTEAQHTWNTIAASFDHTRKKPWSECIDFLHSLPSTSLVADLGCGNGRHLMECGRQCAHAIGLDVSPKLLTLCQQKVSTNNLTNVHLVLGSMTHLPFPSNTLDAVICIASLHNIKGRVHRLHALREIQRVLKRGGRAQISVWSRWQKRYRKYFYKQIFSHDGELGDISLQWMQHGLDIPRFYHLYSKREFSKDLQESGFTIREIKNVQLSTATGPDNYFAVVEK